jgi:superfamily II DNA/RNA helicase
LDTFRDFLLPDALQRALDEMHFEHPTPIQAQAIPIIQTGQDLIGCAQTGTGKTGAFSIPLLMRLLSSNKETALVLVPTRELALQVEIFWKKLTRFHPEHDCVTLIGGVPFHSQIRILKRNPRLFIATPGRLVDHLSRRTLSLSQVKFLVLDEADRMLDMGFLPQLSQILKALPPVRQTLLFSATWGTEMDQLSKKFVRNPLRVTVGTVSQAAPTIHQSVIETTNQQKNDALLDEINCRKGSILIFARTQARTDRLARYLHSYGLEVSWIHGGRNQSQRNSALASFRSGRVRILVATDIAGRGIDIAEIAHVINYDLPQMAEDYIHRIGRTGRAGALGNAVSLVIPEERTQWKQITRLLKQSGSSLPEMKGIPRSPQSAQGQIKAVSRPAPVPTPKRMDQQDRRHLPVSSQKNKKRPFGQSWNMSK